jgi:hypothetical protein
MSKQLLFFYYWVMTYIKDSTFIVLCWIWSLVRWVQCYCAQFRAFTSSMLKCRLATWLWRGVTWLILYSPGHDSLLQNAWAHSWFRCFICKKMFPIVFVFSGEQVDTDQKLALCFLSDLSFFSLTWILGQHFRQICISLISWISSVPYWWTGSFFFSFLVKTELWQYL